MSDTTHAILCPCECGEVVQLSLPGGFAGTTAEVTTCAKWRDQLAGAISVTVPRSQALAFTPASEQAPVRHRDGLVWLGA